MSLNQKMSQKHEDDLSEALGSRRTKGSGSQWSQQTDTRHSRFRRRFAFAIEAKSTLGKSIGLSRKMIEKVEEQASHERPMLAFRFYGNERLTQVDHDWVAMRLVDHEEMVAVIDEGERLAAFVQQAATGLWDHVLVNGKQDIVKLVEASRRECSADLVVGDYDVSVRCACGWFREAELGVDARGLDKMLAVHLGS